MGPRPARSCGDGNRPADHARSLARTQSLWRAERELDGGHRGRHRRRGPGLPRTHLPADCLAKPRAIRQAPPLVRRYSGKVRLRHRRFKVSRLIFDRQEGKFVLFDRFVAILRAHAALLASIKRTPYAHGDDPQVSEPGNRSEWHPTIVLGVGSGRAG
jgi:hypothetical protein